MGESAQDEAQKFLQFIETEVGDVGLRQIRTFLEGGDHSKASHNNLSTLKDVETYLSKTSEIRKFACQICNIIAPDVPLTGLSIHTIPTHIHRYEEGHSNAGKSVTQLETLTRTSVGSPQHKLSKVTLNRSGVSYQMSTTVQLNVDEIVLIWWGSAWNVGKCQEIGGDSSLAMRIHLVGREDYSDIWVNEKEWSYRIRKLVTPQNVCLSRGHLGKTGEHVRVKIVDPLESDFWKDELPIGIVVDQLAQYDSVKVEVKFLSYTETIIVPNSFCAPISEAKSVEIDDVVNAARLEACRLIDAFLTNAKLTATDLDRKPSFLGIKWNKVWQGVAVISGLRVLACVMRQGGAVPLSNEEHPKCQIRITDAVTRVWHVSEIPFDILKRYGGLNWSIQGLESGRVSMEILKQVRFRQGLIEWANEKEGEKNGQEEEEEEDGRKKENVEYELEQLKDGCFALGNCYPKTIGSQLSSSQCIGLVKGLVLKEVEIDVYMFAEIGGGDFDDDMDGVRLVVEVKYSEKLTVKHMFCIWRQDWQGFRPWGQNAGSLPGLRCIPHPAVSSLLLRYIINRMDVYQGCPVLRFPYRSAYPIDFVPFLAEGVPPSGEIEWSKMLRETIPKNENKAGIVWKTSLSLHDGDSSSRWNISVKCDGPFLVISALSISHKLPPLSLQLSLSVNEWGQLGMGPRQWLSMQQQQLFCRRLLCRHSQLLQLHKLKEGNNTTLVLSADLEPKVEENSIGDGQYHVKVRDVGSLLHMKVKSIKSNNTTSVWLSARDLHDSIPSLQLDQANSHKSHVSALAGGLTPHRSCYLRGSERSIRPGITLQELHSDKLDCEACWNDICMNSALRDMEPLSRLSLIQRLLASVKLKLTNIAKKDEHTIMSCPPPLPSSLVPLKYNHVQLEGYHPLAFSLSISPPVSLCRGSGALGEFIINLSGGAEKVVEVMVPRRGVKQRVCFTNEELGECIVLWKSRDTVDDTVHNKLVEVLVSKLQRKAGASHSDAVSSAKTKTSISFSFSSSPLALFVHQASVQFVRSDPLVMRAFDTGNGLLLISYSSSEDHPARSVIEGWEQCCEREDSELTRYLVPRSEFGPNREPLLMSGPELNRLMLGHGRKSYDRSGVTKEAFLNLTLESALSLNSDSERGEGLVKWAAPLVSGASLIGVVSHIHSNGFVDVKLACDGTVRQRVDPMVVKIPLRPDRHLHSYGGAKCWRKLARTTTQQDEYNAVKGLVAVASSNMLSIGTTVEVQDKYSTLLMTNTMKSLQYHRGTREYENVTTRNAEPAVIGSLPEHLSLLLTDEVTDHTYMVHESASLQVGSIRVDTGYLQHNQDDTSTTQQTLKKKETVETPEMAALRERRQAAADMFYSKQFKSFVAKAEELFQKADTLSRINDLPTAEGEVGQVDIGETPDQARKRVLQQNRLFEESAHCFRFALRRTPTIDPSLYGRIALSFHRARDFKDSLANCSKALSFFPTSSRLHFLKGQALLELGRVDDAFASFDRALVVAKEARENDDRTAHSDIPLIEAYRRSAYLKKHKFVDKETLLGEIEVESDDPRQRDIDENLNTFNVYDSVLALTTSKVFPNIEVASKMVNPIAVRLKYRPPPNKLRKSTKKLKRPTAKFPPISLKPEDRATVALHQAKTEGTEELFKWEEDGKGDEDLEVIIEMEIETPDDILEICIRKNDDVSELLDAFFKEHHGKFTHAQMRELRIELRSRLGDSMTNDKV